MSIYGSITLRVPFEKIDTEGIVTSKLNEEGCQNYEVENIMTDALGFRGYTYFSKSDEVKGKRSSYAFVKRDDGGFDFIVCLDLDYDPTDNFFGFERLVEYRDGTDVLVLARVVFNPDRSQIKFGQWNPDDVPEVSSIYVHRIDGAPNLLGITVKARVADTAGATVRDVLTGKLACSNPWLI